MFGRTFSGPTIAGKPACAMTARGWSLAPQKMAARPGRPAQPLRE
jgi:hypothetical protein